MFIIPFFNSLACLALYPSYDITVMYCRVFILIVFFFVFISLINFCREIYSCLSLNRLTESNSQSNNIHLSLFLDFHSLTEYLQKAVSCSFPYILLLKSNLKRAKNCMHSICGVYVRLVVVFFLAKFT